MRPRSPVPRREDWPERLAALVEERRDMPFTWGTHDCATFAADAIVALTDTDPMAPWRGTYADEAGADAIIATHGSLLALAQAVHAPRGLVACPPALAQRGDTALVEHGNVLALGVVLGDTVAVPGPDGLAYVPRSAMRAAWVT